jgi:ribonuclease Z
MGPERTGISMAYVTDTRPCEGGHRLAREADLVYHDATFGDELSDRAVETGHSTAREAAAVARDAGAQRLLLGHFSARYDTPETLVEQAREVFPATDAVVELAPTVLDPREKWGE